MKLNRTTLVTSLLVGLVAVLGLQDALLAQQGGSGRARVLVAVFQAQDGVDEDFGEEIADRLRERVKNFTLLTTVDEDEVEEALERFGLDARDMDLISWRQLASRLNAQLVIYGEVRRGNSSGNMVDAIFVEPGRGDTTQVPAFSVAGDGGREARRAAERISETLDRHVEFLRARLNCQDYLSSDQLEDARRNCDRALEISPENAQALYLRGQIAVEAEDWDEAIDFLERAVEKAPSDEGALQSLAYAHAQAGNMERSVELYREYLEFNPGDVDVRLSVAYNLASADAYAEAMRILQDGLERDSTSAALWKYLGDVAIRSGTASAQANVRGATITDSSSIRTAVEAYRKYAEMQPDSVDAGLYRNIIAAHLQLGKVEAAAEASRRALERISDAPGLWSLRADILSERGDLERAISAMDSVVALDQSYRNALFKRGVFKLRNGQMDAAMEDFGRAIEAGTNPDDVARQLFATGHGEYFQRGRYAQASRMFEAGLEFVQDTSLENQLNFWIGYSHFRRGEQIDQQNPDETCRPARRALSQFEQVLPHMNQAGDYQADSQGQIRDAVDVYLYRQEQIIKKACEG